MLTLAAVFCFSQGLESVQELFENGYSAEYEDLYHRLELNVRLRYLVTLTAGFMLLWVSIVAACSLAGERDRDTWVSLVSTPLTGFEIIRGKVIGAFWSVRALLALWLALVILGLFVGAVHPLGALAVTLATATYLAFGCVLGMVYSLRARTSSRAVVSTLFTLIILSGAYLLVFMPWNVRSELTFVGVTPFVEEVALMSYLDVKWLLDFESPEQRMLNIGLTCVLSVALYAGGAFVLALWTLKSFDRVIDRPGLIKLHKEVTGVDSDYNACEYFYANGQVLKQAFEGAGTLDHEAVTVYLKSHTFPTLIGDIDLRSQMQNIAYTVGQWQNGFFRSVAAVGVPDSELVPVRVKTGWA